MYDIFCNISFYKMYINYVYLITLINHYKFDDYIYVTIIIYTYINIILEVNAIQCKLYIINYLIIQNNV